MKYLIFIIVFLISVATVIAGFGEEPFGYGGPFGLEGYHNNNGGTSSTETGTTNEAAEQTATAPIAGTSFLSINNDPDSPVKDVSIHFRSVSNGYRVSARRIGRHSSTYSARSSLARRKRIKLFHMMEIECREGTIADTTVDFNINIPQLKTELQLPENFDPTNLCGSLDVEYEANDGTPHKAEVTRCAVDGNNLAVSLTLHGCSYLVLGYREGNETEAAVSQPQTQAEQTNATPTEPNPVPVSGSNRANNVYLVAAIFLLIVAAFAIFFIRRKSKA